MTRSDNHSTVRPKMPARVLGGMSMGIGSLPHRCLREAIELSCTSTDIVTIPSLPRRSPGESMVAQALVGIDGVTVGQYGAIAVDVGRIDPRSVVRTDLDGEAFGGFRAFLASVGEGSLGAGSRHPPVLKWQFVGPISLGAALMRAGVPAATAFDVAGRAVRAHVQDLLVAVGDVFPSVEQIVVLDEPDFGAVRDPGFAIAPDVAVDVLSGALAVIEPIAVAGVHCCGSADLAALMSAGPALLSLPASPTLGDSAGYIQRYLEHGGWIAWGAVATDGPVPTSADRPWRKLCELWCQLVQRGCAPELLRQQSLITPECGLATHSPAVAERVLRINRQVSARVRDQAAATRFAFGA